jgi:excisionase family DNA binding protein
VIDLSNIPEIMTPEDAARVLLITARRIKELCRNKQLGHFRIGKKYRIGKVHLMAYIATQSCQKEMQAPALSGARKEKRGRFNGSSAANAGAGQRALMSVKMLKNNSRNLLRTRTGRQEDTIQKNA